MEDKLRVGCINKSKGTRLKEKTGRWEGKIGSSLKLRDSQNKEKKREILGPFSSGKSGLDREDKRGGHNAIKKVTKFEKRENAGKKVV